MAPPPPPRRGKRATSSSPPRVGLVVKHGNERARRLAKRVLAHLRSIGADVVCDDEASAILGSVAGVPRERMAREVDLVVTIGGDGTFLAAARHAGDGAPILGINAGNLGFLAEATASEGLRLIDEALAGEAPIESRPLLDVALVRKGTRRGPFRVLNDAVLNKSAIARIVTLSVSVDGEFLTSYRADGLIVATPTGSTAYNLSAGGPILFPEIDAICLTPICPHTLSHRPIVVPSRSVVEISLDSQGEDVFLTLDGQEGFPLEGDDRVVIRKSRKYFRLVRNRRRHYGDLLRSKLRWGLPIEK